MSHTHFYYGVVRQTRLSAVQAMLYWVSKLLEHFGDGDGMFSFYLLFF